jgi:hypothetical protein
MSLSRLLTILMIASSGLTVRGAADAQAGQPGRCLVLLNFGVEAFREATEAARPVLSKAGCEPYEVYVARDWRRCGALSPTRNRGWC